MQQTTTPFLHHITRPQYDTVLHCSPQLAYRFAHICSILFEATLTPFNLNLQYQAVMERQSDWQGFQSFTEENKYEFPSPPQPQLKPPPILQPDKEEEEQPKLTKKMTFRSKNRRKSSFMGSFPAKKLPAQELLHKTIANRQPHLDKRRISLAIEKKEEGIPIFRESQYPSYGAIVYKSSAPATAEQYLTRSNQETSVGSGEQLCFNSRFESGNLEQVIKHHQEYHLYITVDTNTKGHKQWFYFTATAKQTKTFRFVVYSFKKKLSLFQIGMRPYGKYKREGFERWRPVGTNVRYVKLADNSKRGNYLRRCEYLLSFDIELEKDEEFCVASCIPYSYTFLQERLAYFSFPQVERIQITSEVLCKTLTGFNVPLITVNSVAESKQHSYIIINCRTHPGQSSASWVIDGVIQEITKSAIIQSILLQFNIVIKIVPMLNVEGVYMGNYRTGIMGVDFNRLFLSGSPDLFPEIKGLKQLVQECKSKGRVDLYLDLHGHSILPGCFMYGADPSFAPKSPLKYLIQQMGKSKYFARNHCILGVDSSKTQTSRIYFQVQQGVFSLTCENSLGMYQKKQKKGNEAQFQCGEWQDFGRELINIILNIYQEYSPSDKSSGKSELEEALALINSQEEEDYIWQKSKTDNGKIEEELRMLASLDLDEVDLPRHMTLSQNNNRQENNQSMNDSDNQSQNLSVHKQQELIKMVRKVLKKNNPVDHSPSNLRQSVVKPEQKMNQTSKGQFINNFKQYRFGVEDTTINDWYTRKRLLSVPKHLKTEKQGQSYLIRKKQSRVMMNDQIGFDPVQITKRVLTEQRQPMRRTSFDRFSHEQIVNKQKLLLDSLLMKKH